jgi:hypothetical protein
MVQEEWVLQVLEVLVRQGLQGVWQVLEVPASRRRRRSRRRSSRRSRRGSLGILGVLVVQPRGRARRQPSLLRGLPEAPLALLEAAALRRILLSLHCSRP